MIRLAALGAVALAAACVSPRSEPLSTPSKDAFAPADSPAPGESPSAVSDGGPASDLATGGPVGPSAPDAAAPSRPEAAPPSADAWADSAPPPSCRADQISCNQAPLCESRSWGFEQGEALDGWNLRSYNANIGGRRVRTGAAALAFEVFPGQYSGTSYTFCGRTNATSMYPGVDVRGRTLVAWVNLEVTSGSAAPTECWVGGGGGGAVFRMPAPASVTPDRWIPVRAPIGASDTNGSNVWSFYVECFYREGPAWKGLVHLDDVAFE